jgi:peptidoglycan hydrolase-like amidase
MFLRLAVATLLAMAVAAAALLPGPSHAPTARAATCSGWTSHTEPPATIRVLRVATGEVQTVRFRRYTKNVLSREWIPSWTQRSLRAGALIVRNYAWYQVLNWRGGVNEAGECYDVRDDVRDQVFDPSKPIYRTVARAVDGMWGKLLHRDGAIFPTYYAAGAINEACGTNTTGTRAWQWGTQACGLAGFTPGKILRTYYYPGVRVKTAPTPTPTPTPSATPDPSSSASPS